MSKTHLTWADVALQQYRLIETTPSPEWHPDTVALYQFWIFQAGLGLPERSCFDPVSWPRLLGNIWMFDVVQPFRLRFRLVGTRICHQIECDPTGKWLDEAAPHLLQNAAFIDRYRTVVLEKRPLWTIGPADIRPNNPIRAIENLTLPFTTGIGNVNILMMLSIFHER